MRVTCACRHSTVAHQHYRRGTGCSERGCSCIQLRRRVRLGRAVPTVMALKQAVAKTVEKLAA